MSRVLWQSNRQLGFVSSEDWELMCRQQSLDGTWASELSISAASLLLRRPILVMSDHRLGVFTPCNAEKNISLIRLSPIKPLLRANQGSLSMPGNLGEFLAPCLGCWGLVWAWPIASESAMPKLISSVSGMVVPKTPKVPQHAQPTLNSPRMWSAMAKLALRRR